MLNDAAAHFATLRTLAADAATGWAFGSFGAVAEFVRDADEPVHGGDGGADIVLATARGGLRLVPHPDLRLCVYLQRSRSASRKALALCLPEAAAPMSGRTVLTELGPDRDALAGAGRDGVLFDLGLATMQVDACVRVAPAEAARLRPLCGEPIFLAGGAALGLLLELQPHRVFLTRLGRAEVYQPIPAPDGRSPDGPHTHILPKLLKTGRTHAANVAIVDGLVPCAYAFPPQSVAEELERAAQQPARPAGRAAM